MLIARAMGPAGEETAVAKVAVRFENGRPVPRVLRFAFGHSLDPMKVARYSIDVAQ